MHPLISGVFLLVTVAAGNGASISKSGLNKSYCSWGSKYWCSSPKAAALCRKTDWCSVNVWPFGVNEDLSCIVTQKLVTYSRDLLATSEIDDLTDYDIALKLAKGCSLFTELNDRKQCKTIVTTEDSLLKLVQLITTNLPTKTVALAVGTCQRNTLKSDSNKVQTCTKCEDVVATSQTYIRNFFTAEVNKKVFESTCAKLGQGKNVCLALAAQQYGKMYDAFLHMNPATVCNENTGCYKSSLVLTKQSTDLCSTCQNVVSDIRSLDRSSEVQNVIKKMVKTACVELGPFEQMCDVLADEGLQYFFELIATEMEPKYICEILDFCTLPVKTAIPIARNAYSIVPQIEKIKTTAPCIVCKFVLTEVESFLALNSTEKTLESFLDNVCDRLPATVSDECTHFVKQYGPVIIKLAEDKLNPNLLCYILTLCKNDSSLNVKQEIQPVLKVNDEICDLCKYVVTYIDAFLKKNATEAEIDAILEKVCNILPGNIQQQCDNLVQQYRPVIIRLLLQKLDPSQVCTAIGLCTNSTVRINVKPETQPVTKANSENCDLCKYVVTFIDTFLQKNATEAEMEELLEKVCDVLHDSIKQKCDSFVEQYGPIIIQLLLQEADPTQVCTFIGMCKSTSGKNKVLLLAKPIVKANDELCDLCKYVVTYIDTFVKENATEAEIEAILDKVCDILPDSIKQQCENLVQQYGPLIIQLLLKELDPTQVCNAIGLCKNNTDKVNHQVNPVTKLNDELCDLCKYVVTYIDTFVKENATEAEIEAILDKVCDILPDSIKQQCENLVQQYGPLIIQLLLKELDPTQVCNAIGLCKNNTDKVNHQVNPVTKLNDELCDLCKYVVTYIDTFVKENATEAEIEAILDKVCDILPDSIKQQCENLVQQYGPLIIQLLLKELDPTQVCNAIGLCKNNTDKVNHQVNPVTKLNDELCDLCKYVVTYIDTFVKENATEAEIEAILDKVCDILPDSIKQQCENLVQQYGPLIIQLLLKELDPTQVCNAIGLCKNNTDKVNHQVNPVTKLNDELCDLCKYVVTYIDTFVKENATEAEIEAILDKVCDILPDSIKQQCENLVQQYGPLIIQLLLKELDPTQVCNAIGLCKNNTDKVNHQVNPVTKLNDELCDLCKYVVTYIDTFVKENATEAEIEAILDKVCDILPGSIKQQCENLVQQYGPLIIQLLLKELDPTQVCNAIGLCKNNTEKLQLQAKSALKANEELCNLCKYVVTYIDTFVKENATEAEIEALLDKVCDILPDSIKTQCENLIQKYGPLIIQLLLKELDPTQICTAIGMCTNNTVTSKLPSEMVEKASPVCAICELVMQQLDTILADNSSEAQIKAALDKVCDFLPSSLSSVCQQFVESYAPLIVQLLKTVKPQQICTALGLCTKVATSTAPSKTSGSACVMCEFIMTELDTFLSENSTEEQIKAALNKVCILLPNTLKSECDSIVEQYETIILDMLVKKMDPKTVCTRIHLCSAKTNVISVKKNELCALCIYVFTTLDTLIESNSSKQEIIAALDKVCDYLPSTIKDECESFIDLYLPYVVDLIIQELTPQQICEKLGLCVNQTVNVNSESHPIRSFNSEMCDLCKYAVTFIDTFLQKNATQAEMEALLEKVCDVLPDSMKQKCDSFVEQYGPIIIQLLLQEADPTQICTFIGMCKSTPGKIQVKPQSKIVRKANDELCDLCKYVVTYIDTFVKENATEAEIEAILDKVCDILPGSIKQQCENLVQQYGPLIIQLLIKELDPTQVCTAIGLCKNNTVSGKVNLQAKRVNAELCDLCKYVVTYIDTFLKENATEAEIEAILEKVCNILPGDIKQQCDNLVQQYGPVIIQLLIQNLDPSQVCAAIGLCKNNIVSLKVKLKAQTVLKANAELCDLCKYVVTYIDTLLKKNATETEIEALLEKVCDVLPDSIKQQCDSLVLQYGPIIIQLLINEADPTQVCSFIGLCKNDTEGFKKFRKDSSGPACALCEFVIQELDNILAENRTEDQIKEALQKVCTHLPSSISEECQDFVKTYGPLIIQMLIEKVQPQQICTAIKLCSSQPVLLMTISKVRSGPECAICELILKYLETLVAKNSTEEQIESALYRVCSLLPATVQRDCTRFVSNYTPELVSLLSHFPPEQVCALIKACTVPPQKSTNYKGGPECPLCEFIMKGLETMISKNASEQQIEQALEKVCSLLPDTVKAECDSYITTYTPILVHLLVKMSPDQICTYLKFCTSDIKVTVNVKSLNDARCALCEFILAKLDGFLSKNLTQSEIEKALDVVCHVLPETLRSDCENFISEYGSMIIKLLLQETRPRQVCIAAGICNNSGKKSLMFQSDRPLTTTPVVMEHCSECKFALYYLQTSLADPFWLNQSKIIFTQVCKLLKSGQDDCLSLLNSNFDTLVNAVVAFRFPIEFCQKIALCETPPSILSGKSNHKELTMTVNDDPITTPVYKEHCSECKFALFELQSALADPFWQEKFKLTSEVLCSYLQTGQDTCHSLVDSNIDSLISIITSYNFPINFCQSVDLCEYPPPNVQTANTLGGTECEVCKILVQLLDVFLQANTTVSEVEKLLNAACKLLPASDKEKCESIVRNYTPTLMQLLSQLDDPTKVCQVTNLCPKKTMPSPLGRIVGN